MTPRISTYSLRCVCRRLMLMAWTKILLPNWMPHSNYHIPTCTYVYMWQNTTYTCRVHTIHLYNITVYTMNNTSPPSPSGVHTNVFVHQLVFIHVYMDIVSKMSQWLSIAYWISADGEKQLGIELEQTFSLFLYAVLLLWKFLSPPSNNRR